jgi:hypothetical protein
MSGRALSGRRDIRGPEPGFGAATRVRWKDFDELSLKRLDRRIEFSRGGILGGMTAVARESRGSCAVAWHGGFHTLPAKL